MNDYNEKITSIYIDTNVLECYINDNLFLENFRIHGDYYKLFDYICDNGIKDKVRICIPRIVLEEMKEHYVMNFKKNINSIRDKVADYKRIFGALLDIDYSIKITNIEEYERHILHGINDLKERYNEHFTIVEYPNCFEKLIYNALKSIKPFSKANGNGKSYSDAGFKDALIIESISSHCNLENEYVIFVSNDNDFKDIITNDKFFLASSFDRVKELLNEIYDLNIITVVSRRIDDFYYKERLLNSIDCVLDASVSEFKIERIEQIDENIFFIIQSCVINEVKYTLEYSYDYTANDFLELKYMTTND